MDSISDQTKVTAFKYGRRSSFKVEELRQIDAQLPGLPEGYGEDRLVLLPRDPEWLYTYWDIRHETKDETRRRGGTNLSLRLFVRVDGQLEPLAEYWIHELSRSWYLRVPSPGQTYIAEIGYRDDKGGWLGMLQSNEVSVPPLGPAAEIADHFVTLSLEDQEVRADGPLEHGVSVRAAGGLARAGKTPVNVVGGNDGNGASHEAAYRASRGGDGSGYQAGSIQGGSPRSGPPWSSSTPVEKGRDFWLIADAEVIVFGATDPQARVTLGGRRVRLRQDGSFSVRMAFPDGVIELPIEAVAADGEQKRTLTMHFRRSTEQEP